MVHQSCILMAGLGRFPEGMIESAGKVILYPGTEEVHSCKWAQRCGPCSKFMERLAESENVDTKLQQEFDTWCLEKSKEANDALSKLGYELVRGTGGEMSVGKIPSMDTEDKDMIAQIYGNVGTTGAHQVCLESPFPPR